MYMDIFRLKRKIRKRDNTIRDLRQELAVYKKALELMSEIIISLDCDFVRNDQEGCSRKDEDMICDKCWHEYAINKAKESINPELLND